MSTLNDAIKRAATFLNAFKADNGMWAYWAEESSEGFYVSAAEMALLGRMLDDPDYDDAYSEWCGATEWRRMSARATRRYFDRS